MSGPIETAKRLQAIMEDSAAPLKIGKLNGMGLWTMQNDDVAVSGGMRSGNSPPQTTRMRFILYDTGIWQETGDHEKSEIGFVDLFVQDGSQVPIGLVRIEIKKELRKKGYGRKVIDALVATAKEAGKHFFISDIEPKAKGFWKKTGGEFASGYGSSLLSGEALRHDKYDQKRGVTNMLYNAPNNEPIRLKGFKRQH